MTTRHQHPRFRLEQQLSHPVRFSIVASLAAVEELSFADMRTELEVSDSVLSRRITELEKDGFVLVKKGFVGKRPRTNLKLTTDGLKRWRKHLQALQEIARIVP